MMPYSALAEPLRILLLLMLVLSVLIQFVSFHVRRELHERYPWLSLIAAVLFFLPIPLLCPMDDPGYGFQDHLPLAPVLALSVLLISIAVVRFCGMLRKWRNRLTSYSVKQALEQMPIGLAFFSEQGRMILCNRQMERLVFALTGRDLQMISDIENGLSQPGEHLKPLPLTNSWLFPDGRAWHFARTRITDAEGNDYTEWTASEITEQEKLRSDLHGKNEELTQMIERMKRISLHTADLIREQELLSAKMRVHHQMGSLLLTTRRNMDRLLTPAEITELVEQWRKGIESLLSEVENNDAVDTLEEVIRVAGSIGVAVEVQGDMPEQQNQRYLLAAALRECVTNTIRHANGNLVRIRIHRQKEQVMIVFTNNGTQPEAPIREGGGLSSLRHIIENKGGQMTIHVDPEFRLILTLPDVLKMTEY